MSHRALALLFLLAGCGGDGAPADGLVADMASLGDLALPIGTSPLGMNDVSILVPLPSSPSTPVLLLASDLMADGQPLVSRPMWDRIILDGSGMAEVFADYRALHVVAARFDLCSRHAPGACPVDADGQLRLVLQPIDPGAGADDVSLHALYTIPSAELAALVGELRGLAGLAAGARTAPLQPSPSLIAAPSGPYADRLRTLLRGKATSDRLRRFTFLAQPGTLSSIHWEMRGLDWDGTQFVELPIPTLAATREGATLVASTSFDLLPLVDAPAGLALATSASRFAAANDTDRRAALAALAAIESPLASTADTVQCASCHVATISMYQRMTESSLALADVSGRYASSYDLSIAAGNNTTSARTLRMFGWLGRDAFIGQRVANDTAQALVEMEARYPAP